MNKLLGIFSLALLLLLVCSCSDKETGFPITVSTDKLEFPAGESSLTLEISSAYEWEISSSESWCSVPGTEGVNQPCNKRVLTVLAEYNNSLQERSATITITEIGKATTTVLVTQSASQELNPRLTSFIFRVAHNPGKLAEDVRLPVTGEVITANSSFVIEDKVLIPEFQFQGGGVYLDGKSIVSGETAIDFSGPVVLTIKNQNGKEAAYTVKLVSFTGLPVVYIDTNGVPVDSKDHYVDAKIRIIDNNGLRASTIFENDQLGIKGRGNSTWGMPKKPYRLKFEKKQSLLGEPKDKSWVLLANYMDDACGMRNATAYSFGHASCLDFTPTTHFVEVFLNGTYNGTYQLCEHLKISEDRVNVTDDGFLIEAEQRDDESVTGDIYFWAKTPSAGVELRFRIRDPDVEVGDAAYNAIQDYVTEAQNALYGADFKDPQKGYAKYLNVDTYVDWYVISEITKTNDANLYTSCHMNRAPGGKMNMGPIWDFDICIGNVKWNEAAVRGPEGYWNRESPWFSRLLEDPAFVQKVKTRISYFKSQLPAILDQMDWNAEYIGDAIVQNNRKWGNIGDINLSYTLVRTAFLQDVAYMRSWLTLRLDWLDRASFVD